MSITLKKKNFAKSTLASGITSAATSLAVVAGNGAKFPQSGKFRAVLYGAAYTNPSDDPNAEIVEAELSSGDTFIITRGQESTTAQVWSAVDNFDHALTAGTLEEIESEFGSVSLLGNGYAKLQNGLVIQWGLNGATTGGSSHSFPTAFPNAGLAIVANPKNQSSTADLKAEILSASQFRLTIEAGSPACYWIAIGH